MSKLLVENFLKSLYTDKRTAAKEWRGANNPYGDDSNRPNLIRKCMTLEGNRQKINCLRKLRDAAAMNPFYQARLDRFVDAVTDIYEPTPEQGTIPGNEFKPTAVGDDLTEGAKDVLAAYGRRQAKKGAITKGKRKPDRSPQEKIAVIQKMKARQCSKRPTPELKAKCIKFYDAKIAQLKG